MLATERGKDCYDAVRAGVLRHISRAPNTFDKYIKHLKDFLGWCEEQDDEARWPPSPRWRKFEAPARYVGVDSFDVEEVRALQALDFRSNDGREVVEGYLSDNSRNLPTRYSTTSR